MIVVDTSSIFAGLFSEEQASDCASVFLSGEALAISAGTLAEARGVAARAGVSENLQEFVSRVDFEVVVVNKAKLNFGDMFAYVLAKRRACPLLFVGSDFAQTDIVSALR